MKHKSKIILFFAICLAISLFHYPTIKAGQQYNARLHILKGDTLDLSYYTSDYKWNLKSNNPQVVKTTKQKNQINGLKKGKAIITAKSGNQTLTFEITVHDSVDIICFAGQSNMTGMGDAKWAPDIIPGTAYTYNPVSAKDRLSYFTEPFGLKEGGKYLEYGMTPKGSLVASFVNSYYQQTKTPIVAIPATSPGSGSGTWVNYRYKGVISRINDAEKVVQKKGITIRHVYFVWFQGETDGLAGTPAKEHIDNITEMYSKIKKKTSVEKCFVIGLPNYHGYEAAQQNLISIRKAQKALCKKNKDYYLISDIASTFGNEFFLGDLIHLNQVALNLIGEQAGKNAGKYVKKQKITSSHN